MDDSKGKLIAAAGALLLLVILTPLFIISLAAEDEQKKSALVSCGASVDGEQMVVPPEYQDAIRAAAKTANLPEGVIAAQLFTESRFNPKAVNPSGAGARGIAQFIPSSWEVWGNGADPFDPFAGIDAQGRYMAQLQKDIASLAHSDQQRIELALAAYNAGPAAVLAAGGIPPIPETQAYVPQIMGLAQAGSGSCEIPGGDVIGEVGSGKWVLPLADSWVTSPFGYRGCVEGVGCADYVANHNGLDLATSGGTGTVVAATDLVITEVSTNWDAGLPVIGHAPDDPSVTFKYLHCAEGSHRVRAGQTVAAGTPLCTEGQSGDANGRHLHFMILKDGTPVDPEPILLSHNVPLRYQ